MKSKPITKFVVSGIIIGGMTFPVIVAGAKSVSTTIVSSKKVKLPGTTQTMQTFFDLFNGKKNRNWGISDELLKIEYNHTEQRMEEMVSSIPESSVA